MNRKILIVEDERSERNALARILRLEEFAVVAVGGAEEALAHIEESIDLVITDLRMGPQSGMDLLHAWKCKRPFTPFILVTAHGDIETAVESMKLGASNFLTKPVNPQELLGLVRQYIGNENRAAEPPQHDELGDDIAFDNIIGRSPAMLEVFDRIRRAALAESTILVTGESGTGKELVAQSIHAHSNRKGGPFVAVNMAAVPQSLVESELFGHIKGAFTGATSNRVGRFQAADGGTLFIDEIGDFALESQAKLLRVLENRVITPVGGNTEVTCNTRVVAATSRDLQDLCTREQFREDLYYRLSVVRIHLPSLRQRRADIPLLVNHLLTQLCETNARPMMQPDEELMMFLQDFPWPGNVRQLANCLESMVVMAKDTQLGVEDVPPHIKSPDHTPEDSPQIPAGATIADLEKQAVQQALDRHDGNKTRAAESLGISVRTLQRKLKSWTEDTDD